MRSRVTTVPRRQSGVSLIELMVALVIGLFLILGAVTVYNQSRNTYRTIEAVARLQETARYAFDVLEPDVRMASYWGLASRPDYIINRAAPAVPTPADLAGAEAEIDACGNNWVVNLDQYIAGWNGVAGGTSEYGLALACAAYQANWRDGTDGLIVRRAAEAAPATMVDDRLYIQSSRIQGTMFIADYSLRDPAGPRTLPASRPTTRRPPRRRAS